MPDRWNYGERIGKPSSERLVRVSTPRSFLPRASVPLPLMTSTAWMNLMKVILLLGRSLIACVVLLCFFNESFAQDNSSHIGDAIRSGRVSEVRQYYSKNHSLVNARVLFPRLNQPHRPMAFTPLEVAVRANQLAVAKLLIAMGANVNDVGEDTASALHIAAARNNKKMLNLLINSGARVDIVWDNSTPLNTAAAYGNQEAAEVLLAHGARLNRPGAVATPLKTAIEYDHKKTAKLLISNGANCNVTDVNGSTLLHEAAVQGLADAKHQHVDPGLIDLLVECGVDVNIRDNSGNSPLHSALAFGNSMALAERLLARGADPNARNKTGMTPLLLAARYQKVNLPMIRMMVAHGALVGAADKFGTTLLHYFCLYANPGNSKAVAFLLAHDSDFSGMAHPMFMHEYDPIHAAASTGQTNIVKILIAKGADIDKQDDAGRTPLMLAILKNHIGLARWLIGKGADVNVSDKSGMTSLHWAARENDRNLVRLLIANGANVDVRDKDGLTPVRLANDKSVIRVLKKHGAAVRPAVSVELTKRVCGAVVTQANNGTLNTIIKNDAPNLGIVPLNPGDDWGGDFLANVNKRQYLEIDGAQYILGSSPHQWRYLSRVAPDHIEEMVCQFGLRKKPERIVESKNDRLCRAALRGNLNYAQFDIWQSGSSSAAKVDIDNDGIPDLVVQLKYSSNSDGDCDFTSLGILNADNAKLQPLSTLISGEDCDGSSLRPFVFDGATYIEEKNDPEFPINDHHVFRLQDGALGEICRFEVPKFYYVMDAAQTVIAAAGSENAFVYALEKPDLTDLRKLLRGNAYKRHSVPLNGIEPGDSTVLCKALQLKRDDALELLLRGGVDPNLAGNEGGAERETALALALRWGTVKSVRMLLEFGTSPTDMGTNINETPVLLALSSGEDAKLELVLKHGAAPGQLDWTKWLWLINKKSRSALRLLAKYGASIDPTTYAVLMNVKGIPKAGSEESWKLVDEMSRSDRKSCSDVNGTPITDECLPSVLRQTDEKLNKQYIARLDSKSAPDKAQLRIEERAWIMERDKTCRLHLEPDDYDGWLSYVLTDRAKAECVINATRLRTEALQAAK